jgi:RNA 2',3'-cyclic 3'-phosphodiesterase
MRLFLGIPIEPAVVKGLSTAAARLRSKDDGLRWPAAESWHITLQFLGKTSEEQYDCIAARLRKLRFRAVPVRIESLGFFDRAGVFFAGVVVSPELLELQQRVTAATSLCGLKSEERAYHPHVTLARSKGREGVRALRSLKSRIDAEAKFGAFVTQEFVLYESVPQPGGSQYIVRERFGLNQV